MYVRPGIRTRARDIVLVVAGVAALTLTALAQQPTPQERPTFRGGISLVEVSAVVTGDDEKVVTGLTRDDFEVFEDGEPRPLASVRFLDATRASAPAPPTPGLPAGTRLDEVVTNRDLADAPAFVLLLDDLNISPYDSHRAIRAGLGVLEAIPKDALVSVVNSSGEGGGLITLGRPNQGHADRVKAFRGQYLPVGGGVKNPMAISTTPSSVDAPCGVGSDVVNSPDCADPTRAARRAGALSAVGELFSRTGSRRKVLFWFVTDMGVSPLDPRGNGDAQFAGLQRLLRGDVTVYAIDPRENFAPTEGKPVFNDRGTGGRMRVGTADTTFQGRGGSTISLGTDDMVRIPLTQIARDTGGRWIQNANNVEKLAAEVVRQNLASYVIAYESAASAIEGRHRIEVKVKRRGLKVSSRRAFVVEPRREEAPSPAASPDVATSRLAEVIRGGVPFGTLALRVHVAPQFASDGPARALVTLRVEPDTAIDAPSIDLLVLAADDTGKVGSVERFAMSRPSADFAWEGSITLTLAPGQYQLRVAASTPDGQRTGLLLHPIDMRKPSGDLVLGVPTLLGEDADGVRPTLARTFPPGHPLAYQVEVAGDAVRGDRAEVRARLLDASGSSVRDVAARVEAAGEGRLRATGVVTTEGVPAGGYTLVVEARQRAEGRPRAHAIPVRFEVGALAAPVASRVVPTAGSTAMPATESSATAPPAAPSTTSAPRALTPLSVASGPLTRSAHRGPLVIVTEEEWRGFWRTLPTRQAAPNIDFDRVTLLAVVSEDEAPATPRITRVTSEPGGFVVEWTSEPMAAPPASSEPPRPFVVVGLTDVAGSVRFVRVP
ncbi:VWA domain-containing protein [Luteitalea sp. TBR-22]|uniref:VWA domain-containing protein n=1 Tax=Luteitalea sp. TBR-22 TaxID=2802971 RepID=UPI001EF5F470|nr:VWA domain-containing protein [Luteitalea sp. TBR-22]